MKKLLAILLILTLAIALAACGKPSDEEIKAVRNVSFAGTELTVVMGANKSTGYEWDYQIYGECIEPSINQSFKLTGSEGDATGEVSIGFEGKSEGTAVIVFTTPNGWDGTGVGEGYTVDVEVAADGSIVSAVGTPGANAPQLPHKTSLTIEDINEGTYTGTLSGVERTVVKEGTDNVTMYTTYFPADITVTIENGQITVYCEAKVSSYAMIQDVKTPQTPDYFQTATGTLPLQQSGDAVIADGMVPVEGHSAIVYYTDGVFDRWELRECGGEEDKVTCIVNIAMEDGVLVAEITLGKSAPRTATVPLALASDVEATGNEALLSAPYAEMLKSGAYQYSYPLDYDGKPYTATIATYNGMICRKVVSDDGVYAARVVTINGNGYEVDDISGAVRDLGPEGGETLPDYAGSLTYVATKTLETGTIAEAYDFEYDGAPANIVFVFSEGQLVEFVTTVDGVSAETFVTEMTGTPDMTLFDAPL